MKHLTLIALLIFSIGKIDAQITHKKGTYKLVISFISKGAGIDRQSAQKIDSLIQNFPKKPAYEICHMGREGETSYLFMLKELKKHEQKKFIKEVKEQILNKDMVLVEENKQFEAPCR